MKFSSFFAFTSVLIASRVAASITADLVAVSASVISLEGTLAQSPTGSSSPYAANVHNSATVVATAAKTAVQDIQLLAQIVTPTDAQTYKAIVDGIAPHAESVCATMKGSIYATIRSDNDLVSIALLDVLTKLYNATPAPYNASFLDYYARYSALCKPVRMQDTNYL